MTASRDVRPRSYDNHEPHFRKKNLIIPSVAAAAAAPSTRPPAAKTNTTSSSLTFYPAYCNRDSLTWWKWVKLTTHDIHHKLTVQPKFHTTTRNTNTLATINSFGDSKNGDHHSGGQNNTKNAHDAPLLLFYLNHPIQFVQVVGVVVTFDDFYENFWLFNIDDSSGAILEVNCRKPSPPQQHSTPQNPSIDGRNSANGLPGAIAQPHPTKKSTSTDPDELNRLTLVPTLSPGTSVQLRGRLATFRSTRQLRLDRITILPSTTHELTLIAQRTEFLRTVLSRPWCVSDDRKRELYLLARDGDEQEERKRKRRRGREGKIVRREERHAVKIREGYEAEEREREEAAEVARQAGMEFEKWKRRKLER